MFVCATFLLANSRYLPCVSSYVAAVTASLGPPFSRLPCGAMQAQAGGRQARPWRVLAWGSSPAVLAYQPQRAARSHLHTHGVLGWLLDRVAEGWARVRSAFGDG